MSTDLATAAVPEAERSPSRRRRPDPRVTWAVRAVAVVAAVVAAIADVAPTGLWIADRAWTAAAVGGLVILVSRATRNTWLWMTALTAVAAVGSWAVVPAIGALVVAAASTTRPLRPRPYGAVVGALCGIALLHLPPIGPHGTTAVVTVVAVAPAVRAGYLRSPRRSRRRMRIGLWVLVGAVLLAGASLAVAAALTVSDLTEAVADAQDGLELVREGEQTEGARHFDESARRFDRAESLLGGPLAAPARVVPLMAQHAEALETAADSGRRLARSAEVAASVAPYRDLKADEGTIDVTAIRAMQRPVADAAASLEAADADLESARSPWLLDPATAAIDEFQTEIREAIPEAVLADKALAVAPALLGAEGDRQYLVLFTTPAESRYLGGFTGSYGLLTASGGEVDFTVTGAINDLSRSSDWRTRSIEGHDEFLSRYGKYHPERNFQNLTVSPDMQTTAEVAASLYQQTTGTTIDGVVVVDPIAIAGLLELTGPIEVDSIEFPLTADNAAEFLLRDQYILYQGERGDRKDRLEDAGRATFDALTERSLPGPREIGRVLGPIVDQKRLLFYPFVADEQDLLERVGALGRFEVPDDTDFVSLRTADARPNKIDTFLYRTLDYTVRYDPGNGRVRATATVTLRNDAPPGGLPDYLIGPDDGVLPLGTTRIFAAVYSPLRSTGATLDGVPVGIGAEPELGGFVYSRLVAIPPGGTATLVIELDGTIDMGDRYRLEVDHQPLVNPDGLTVTVQGGDGGRTPRASSTASVDDGVARIEDDAWEIDQQHEVAFG